MELENLKEQWRDYHQKLDQAITLNQHLFKEIRVDKVRGQLRGLLVWRVAEALCFLAIVIALGRFIAANLTLAAPMVSACILMVFGLIGLSGSIGQIALLATLDYSHSVTSLQRQVARIQTHALGVLRLFVLSIPFYLSYVFLGFQWLFNVDLYASAHRPWLILHFILSLGLVFPVLWLYRELGFRNSHHSWMQRLIHDNGGRTLAIASGLLGEIDELEGKGD